MYPSTNTNNLGNTNTTNTTPLSDNYLPNDNNNSVNSTTNPNSSSSSFHPIHSPYIYYEEDPSFFQLHDYYFHQHQHQHQPSPILAQQTMENHTDEHVPILNGSTHVVVDHHHAFCNNTSNQIPRKRTSKKDRHSKINTAHGPRDRRMRLSLDVAQKFFGLQDMLGFDKASKTVQWLLTKSKTAIKQLTNSSNVSNTTSASSTSNNSECEVLSGIIDDSSQLSLPRETDKAKAAAAGDKKAVTTKGARVSRAFHPLAKETREKARARARERTVEKRIRRGNGSSSNYYDINQAKKIPCIDQTLNRHLGSWSPFEGAGEEESSSRIQIGNEHPHPSSFLQADHHQHQPVSPMQHKQDTTVSGWTSPSPLFNYQRNIAGENQFPEFQCFGKTWDHAYNNN